MSASPIVTGAGEAIGAAFAEPDRTPHSLWEHCRNNLGIARLLVHEGRPRVLVETACRMAVESACRAGLAQAGLTFDGDVEHALTILAAPRDLWVCGADKPAAAELAAAERIVGWMAEYLRSEAPEHAWGY